MPVNAVNQNVEKTVRVACGINKSLYLDDQGEIAGYCSEYLTDLAQINHWRLEYVEGSWTESVQNLYDGKIDLLFPTQMTEERKSTMGFSTSIGGYQPIGLYARGDSGLFYDDYEAFNGTRIAVSAGTSNETVLQKYASDNGFTYEPVYMNTTADKMKALQDGKVDMIVFSTLNDVPDGKVVAMLDYLPFYYCTRIDDTQLLNELNKGMNQMLIRHADVVQDVFYNFMNKSISFAYTREEQEAITQHGKIIVGVYKDTAPLFDIDEDGSYTGIYVDLLHRIEELSGMDIEIRVLDRKEYVFDYLNQGELDFVLGSSDQALKYADNQGYEQSEGIMDYYSINITRADYTYPKDGNMVFALTGGRRYWASILKKQYPQATIEYYLSSKDCLNAVQQKKADATILNSWEYNYQSKNQRYENLIEWENSRTLSQTVFVSLDSQNELIQSVLNKSIEQITNSEKEAIITSNLNRPYREYDMLDRFYGIRKGLLLFASAFFTLLAGFVVYAVMRKKSMRELEAKNQQLSDANTAKDLFLSRMSHELRTPLNAIQGYSAVMEQELDGNEMNEQKLRNHIRSIERAAGYQMAIIGDLLDIQRIESGKLQLAPVEIDITGYMENIVEMIHLEAQEKSIDFSYQRLTQVNETYILDGMRFQQVLLNVLHNAVKFTPQGGKVSMTVEVIDQDETNNTLKFVISDNGIGMSEDFQQNYLFHRFAQEHSGNTSPYEGCGTGLAISRDLLHLMGGEITCKSTLGSGSVFTIILTAKHTAHGRRRRRRQAVTNYQLPNTRILLCEDNPMNQDMEKRILERMGASVDIADDGAIGVKKYRDSQEGYYDVILMDIRMPNMDGLQAAREIRHSAREDASTIPILAVSANAFDEDVQKSLEAGMNEHLAKPVDVAVLYQKIQEYTRQD